MRACSGKSHRYAVPLRAMVVAASSADPRDKIIGPMGNRHYTTMFGVLPDTVAVLRTVLQIETDPIRVMQWYEGKKIASLGYLTASELVNMGRASVVIDFLKSIRKVECDEQSDDPIG